MCILYVIVYNFPRFRSAENHTPQDHFRCVMVCYRTHTPQKTRPAAAILESNRGLGGLVQLMLAKHSCVKFEAWALTCAFLAPCFNSKTAVA